MVENWRSLVGVLRCLRGSGWDPVRRKPILDVLMPPGVKEYDGH